MVCEFADEHPLCTLKSLKLQEIIDKNFIFQHINLLLPPKGTKKAWSKGQPLETELFTTEHFINIFIRIRLSGTLHLLASRCIFNQNQPNWYTASFIPGASFRNRAKISHRVIYSSESIIKDIRVSLCLEFWLTLGVSITILTVKYSELSIFFTLSYSR